MNKEKILKLADFIEKSDSFSMHWPYWTKENKRLYGKGIKNTEPDCPACILGHFRVMEGSNARDDKITLRNSFGGVGKKYYMIVYPDSIPKKLNYLAYPGDPTYITKTMAVDMLRNLAETDKVEWRVQN